MSNNEDIPPEYRPTLVTGSSTAVLSSQLMQDEKQVGKSLKKNVKLSEEELEAVNSREGLLKLLDTKKVNVKKALIKLRYEQELEQLQIALVKLQRSVQQERRRVAIIFEGRDAAGKGGTIRRFIEHLNPRSARVVALPKPTELQKGQWYFQRYAEQLPNPGEMVFFRQELVQPRGGGAGNEFLQREAAPDFPAAGPGIRAHALRR
jgi:polyphosphate kinase 2 (PPK2 family)